MDYYTTVEQEAQFTARQRQRQEQQQDQQSHRMRQMDHRPQTIAGEDRIFFVESDGKVYLGDVKPETECPLHPVPGGGSYGVDFIFVREVEGFLKRNDRYMVLFQMKQGYSHRSGIYPARMTSSEEELILEDL